MKTTAIAFFAAALIFMSGCSEKKERLFNGKDLTNWNFVVENDARPAGEVFLVEDGVILIKGEPFGYMFTKEKYGDCTLEAEWRWVDEPANSGIFVLIEEPANPFPKGIESQLKAGQAGDLVLLKGADLREYVLPEGATERPAFPIISKQEESSEKLAGEWNKARIVLQDGVVEVYINGILQNRATSDVKEGYIGLQSEGGEVQFRHVAVTR